MSNHIGKKGFVIGIILVFVGTSILPSIIGDIRTQKDMIDINELKSDSSSPTSERSSQSLSRGEWLYVGGNGPGNYSKINDAYNDANPGDTIFVYSGIYYEFLWIKKTINLIGEDPDTTSIIYNHKSEPVIRVVAPNVIISGFTLYNPNPNLIEYILIYGKGNYTSISNCIFYNSALHFDDNSVGICIAGSSYMRVSNCTFLYNDDEGICLNHRSNHNIIENCTFSNCCMGIEFQNSTFNIIENCTMNDGLYGIGISDKEPYISHDNIISNCTINNNEQGGIYLNLAYNNLIYNCSLDNNQNYGIWVRGSKTCNNLLVKNKISNSGEGLLLDFSCHNNTFSKNHISYCSSGVYIEDTGDPGYCTDNRFYHNNFIYNIGNAHDECSNIWDNGYPSGGNYWDDYTGDDNNGDGIGDTPYNITGGQNKDLYPLMEPWVTDELTIEANGPYYGLINVPLHFSGLAVGGLKPYTWLWEFGDGNTSNEQNPSYTYTKTGKYDVILTVTDLHSNSSNDTTFAWIQETNDPPHTPNITGETKGKVRIDYEYQFEALDPDENPVWYWIEWGDETSSGWVGPYNSGQQVTISHSWSKKGTYTIKAKAKDPYNTESDWETLSVTMPLSYDLLWFQFFEWLFERFPFAFSILRYLLRYIH